MCFDDVYHVYHVFRVYHVYQIFKKPIFCLISSLIYPLLYMKIVNINLNIMIDHNQIHLEIGPCEDNKTEDVANNPDADDNVGDHSVSHKLDLDHCLCSRVRAEDGADLYIRNFM